MPSLALFLFASCLSTAWLMDQKALDEFVNQPDPHYEYSLLETNYWPGVVYPSNIDTINMTSQKWLDDLPYRKAPFQDSCLLIIRSGQNDDMASSKVYSITDFLLIPETTKTVAAELLLVPFQPLTFYNHPLGHKNLTGLDLFAYTWWRFMNDPTAPPHWLVEFPMVKAIVRAMDTITDYVKKQYKKDVRRFTLLGVSTAGWVSWLAAAVDKRVEGIVPIALDFLNFTESFHHHYQAYCGWSYMLRPFHEMNITQELDNPRFRELASHVDPLAYNERYANIAKYIIILTGDEFSQPDNSRNYFSQLEGVKYLQIIPNSDYGFQIKGRLSSYMLSFYVKLVKKKNRLPKVSWEIKRTNTSVTITLKAGNTYRAYSYYADTVGGTRRDFRMKIAAGNSTKNNPVKWIKTELREAVIGKGIYKAEMEKPKEGWRGFFIQAVYPRDGFAFKASSEMVILPDTFPCPDCEGEGCRGTLV